LQCWVPVELLTFIVGSNVRMQSFRSKRTPKAAQSVNNMVEICSHPFPIFAAFEDLEKIQSVVDNLFHPVQVRDELLVVVVVVVAVVVVVVVVALLTFPFVSSSSFPKIPQTPVGQRLPKTLSSGMLGIPISELVVALLRQGIIHVCTTNTCLLLQKMMNLLIYLVFSFQVYISIYGQKSSSPFDIWLLAVLEDAVPQDKRNTGIDIAVQRSIREGQYCRSIGVVVVYLYFPNNNNTHTHTHKEITYLKILLSLPSAVDLLNTDRTVSCLYVDFVCLLFLFLHLAC
jgi:hypothetical protein